MEEQLQEYIQLLMQYPAKENTISVWELESLARAGIAIHNLVVSESLDDTFGQRNEHLSRLKRLYLLCKRRFEQEKELTLRCQLINTMQDLSNEPFSPFLTWRDECYDLVNDFIEQTQSLQPNCSLPEWLWCIGYWHYPLGDNPAEDDSFRHFKHQLADWVDEWRENRWQELSLLDALYRLDLLNANSYMFLDDTYDEVIRTLYAHYREQALAVHSLDSDSLRIKGLLYEQSQNFQAYHYDHLAKKAAARYFATAIRQIPQGTEEWLYAVSYLVVDLCGNIIEKLHEEDLL